MKIDFDALSESWMYIGFVVNGHGYIMGNALVGHVEAKTHFLKFANIGQKLAYMEIRYPTVCLQLGHQKKRLHRFNCQLCELINYLTTVQIL